MLDLANDIRSLSDFKRNTVELVDRLRETGHPLVLTVNGKAELVVQDAAAYQALLDRVEAIEGIQRGLADVKARRTKPARQVFDRLRRKHGIPVEIARNAEAELEELYLWVVEPLRSKVQPGSTVSSVPSSPSTNTRRVRSRA